MDEFNTSKQADTTTPTIDFASIDGILNIISTAFETPEEPLTPLPAPLLLVGGQLRTGLSADDIASKIIARQSEAGLIVGDVFADGQNTAQAMELIRIEEIIKALLNDAKIEIVIPPGIAVSTIGVGNLGAPVASQGVTTNLGIGVGVIR